MASLSSSSSPPGAWIRDGILMGGYRGRGEVFGIPWTRGLDLREGEVRLVQAQAEEEQVVELRWSSRHPPFLLRLWSLNSYQLRGEPLILHLILLLIPSNLVKLQNRSRIHMNRRADLASSPSSPPLQQHLPPFLLSQDVCRPSVAPPQEEQLLHR